MRFRRILLLSGDLDYQDKEVYMDFEFNEEQEIFRKSVTDFMNKEFSLEKVKEYEDMFDKEINLGNKGYPAELYKKMADLGWLGLPFPERYSGIECPFIYLVVLFEEMGKVLFPSPYLSTVVLSGEVILRFGNERDKEKFLPKIISGDITLNILKDINVKLDGDKFIINGRILSVPYADSSDYFIIVSNIEKKVYIFIVESKIEGIKINILRTIGGERNCEVILDNLTVQENSLIAKLEDNNEIVKIFDRAKVVRCAEMVGSAQAALEMATQYSKERVQFDRPIGSFQAISHRLAEIATRIEGGRLLLYKTAWMIEENIPCEKEIAMTKSFVSEAYTYATTEGEQTMGGYGYMKEYNMQLFYKRAKEKEFNMGDPDFNREVIASLINI